MQRILNIQDVFSTRPSLGWKEWLIVLPAPIAMGLLSHLIQTLLGPNFDVGTVRWTAAFGLVSLVPVILNLAIIYKGTTDVVGYAWVSLFGGATEFLFQISYWPFHLENRHVPLALLATVLAFGAAITLSILAERYFCIQRYYHNLARLTPRLNHDYVYAIRVLKDGLDEIYTIKEDFLSKAVQKGLDSQELPVVGSILTLMLHVVTSMQQSERLGSGLDHSRALFQATLLLDNARLNVYDISDRVVRGVVKLLVSKWLEKVKSLIQLSDREPSLEVRVRTPHILVGRRELLQIEIENEGNGSARGLLVTLVVEPGSLTIEGRDSAREYLLSPGESFRESFQITAHREGTRKFRLELSYVNEAGVTKELRVEEYLKVLAKPIEPTFTKVPNPYEFGKPIKGSRMFFGRHDILRRIDEELSDPSGPTQPIALWGQRRIGKTSILYQICSRSKGSFIPCLVDVQRVVPQEPRRLFRVIVREIHTAYREVTGKEPPKADVFRKNLGVNEEFETFDRDITRLDDYIRKSTVPPLLLLLDEIEALGGFREGTSDLFGYFRGLIQATDRILFLVAGSTGLFNLAGDVTSPFYNLFSTVECRELEAEEAGQLVKEPCEEVGLVFADEAVVEELVESAGCNPYLLQGLCHYLIRRVNKQRRLTVSLTDIHSVADAFVAEQSAYFKYFWEKTSALGRLALLVSAREETARTEAELLRLMKERFKPDVDRAALGKELQTLESSRILLRTDLQGRQTQAYRISNYLFPKWILRSKDASLRAIAKQFEIEKGQNAAKEAVD